MDNTVTISPTVTRTDFRYFAYGISPKGGVLYYGKEAMDNDDIDFWNIESRGYNAKGGAQKKLTWFETQKSLLPWRETGVVRFTLDYTCNDHGNERPLRYMAERLTQGKAG